MARIQIKICECGRHGCFIGRNGLRDLHFCSQQAAIRMLDSALSRGELSQPEVWERLRKIQSAKLPENRKDVDPRVRDQVHQWVLMCAATNDPDKLSPEQFHDFFPLEGDAE